MNTWMKNMMKKSVIFHNLSGRQQFLLEWLWLKKLPCLLIISSTEKKILNYDDNNDEFFEGDLEYPDKLHDLHKESPLAPEITRVLNTCFEYTRKNTLQNTNIGKETNDANIKKLILDPMDKNKKKEKN